MAWGSGASRSWGVTIAGQPNNQTRKDRATQPMDHRRLRWATFKSETQNSCWWSTSALCCTQVVLPSAANEVESLQKSTFFCHFLICSPNFHFLATSFSPFSNCYKTFWFSLTIIIQPQALPYFSWSSFWIRRRAVILALMCQTENGT